MSKQIPSIFSLAVLGLALTLPISAADAQQRAPHQDEKKTEQEAGQETGEALSQGEQETPVVLVTSTRTEHDLMEVPISVTVVDSEEIRRNPQGSVADQLAEVPGVTIFSQVSGGNRRVFIRGMAAYRTLVIIDGVKQPELRGIDGSGISVDPADIERIEVIKGPASVLYGSDAIGGVVNVITKKGRGTDRPFRVESKVVFDGSNNSVNPYLAVSGEIKGFNYRLSGDGLNAHDRRAPGGDVWHSAYTQRNYKGQIGYGWDKGRVEFQAEKYQGTNEHVPTVSRNGRQVPVGPDEASTVGDRPRNDRDTYGAQMVLDDLTDNLVKLTVSGYAQKLKNESRSFVNLTTATQTAGVEYSHSYNDHDSFGGSLQTDWRIAGSHFISLGLDYDKTDFEAENMAFNRRTGLRTSRDTSEGYQEVTALFLQDEWSITSDWLATLGLRQTWVKTALTGHSSNSRRINSTKDDNMVGSLGLVYSGIDNFAFRALFSQGYRNPNLLQLFMGSGTFMLPNPELKPESSNNYELGVRYDNGAFNADLALFLSDFKDGIQFEETSPGSGTYQYYNVDKVRSWGAELAMSYRFGEPDLSPYGSLTPYAGLSLLRYQTEDDGFKTVHTGRPAAWGNLGLKWEKSVGDSGLFFVDGDVMMSRGAYSQSSSGTISNRKAPFQTANLSLGLEGELGGRQYNAVVSFRNIFDQDYTQIMTSNIPEPGRHVVVSVGFSF